MIYELEAVADNMVYMEADNLVGMVAGKMVDYIEEDYRLAGCK